MLGGERRAGRARWIAIALPIAVMAGAALGCSGGSDRSDVPGDTLTRRERDSLIGRSRLPGAQGVRGATRIADSATVRNRRLDSIARNP